MGGVAVKASELAKTATTDKCLLPHLSDLVDLSEMTPRIALSAAVMARVPAVQQAIDTLTSLVFQVGADLAGGKTTRT